MFIKLYSIALAVFVAIDSLWLTIIAKSLYKKYLGYLMTPSPNFFAAILFYLLFIIGLVYFVISPALQSKNLGELIFRAALFGLITYATYDLTNLATIKDWPILITIVDLVWGMSVSILVSIITFYLSRNG